VQDVSVSAREDEEATHMLSLLLKLAESQFRNSRGDCAMAAGRFLVARTITTDRQTVLRRHNAACCPCVVVCFVICIDVTVALCSVYCADVTLTVCSVMSVCSQIVCIVPCISFMCGLS